MIKNIFRHDAVTTDDCGAGAFSVDDVIDEQYTCTCSYDYNSVCINKNRTLFKSQLSGFYKTKKNSNSVAPTHVLHFYPKRNKIKQFNNKMFI